MNRLIVIAVFYFLSISLQLYAQNQENIETYEVDITQGPKYVNPIFSLGGNFCYQINNSDYNIYSEEFKSAIKDKNSIGMRIDGRFYFLERNVSFGLAYEIIGPLDDKSNTANMYYFLGGMRKLIGNSSKLFLTGDLGFGLGLLNDSENVASTLSRDSRDNMSRDNMIFSFPVAFGLEYAFAPSFGVYSQFQYLFYFRSISASSSSSFMMSFSYGYQTISAYRFGMGIRINLGASSLEATMPKKLEPK
jgi:hypothetical protein